MRKLLALLTLSASWLLAQTMVLTPSYISTLKARVNNVNPVPVEWTNLRSTCDWVVQYTATTPDRLPPVYASMEGTSDGGGNGNNAYMRLGTDGNYYESGGVDWAYSASLCYLTLRDGDVRPYGWSYTWNGISLTPQQYGILAGMQAIKLLNKVTPPMVHMTPASPPAGWHGITWRQVDGEINYRMDRTNSAIGITGSVDVTVANQITSAQTNSGTNTLYFSSTTTAAYGYPVFTVGDYAVGPNIPAGTTILTVTPNTSIKLSANVTGNISAGTLIADLVASDNCSPSTGTSQVFVGSGMGAPNNPAAHAPVVFTNIMGPLGTIMNGNTYYVDPLNKTSMPPFNSNNYGFYLDTDGGGASPLCVAVNQGVNYRGQNVGSGENYNHQPQEDNEYSPRNFLPSMSMLYDWLHPLLNQSVASALNTLAALEPTAVKSTFTAGGTAWNASSNPWTAGSANTPGNYPQAIPTSFSTLQAQVLDSMDCWTRDLLWGYYSNNDVGSFATTMNNYHQGIYAGLGMAGIAAYNDDARGQAWYDYWRNHMHLLVDQPYSARWMGANGSPMDSYNYAPLAVTNIALAMIANSTAMGDNLITNASQPFTWIEGVEYYKHNLDPGGLSMLSRGYIFAPAAIPPCVNCASTQELIAVQAAADLGNHPLKNKFRSFVQNQINLYGEGAGWLPFLLWDPSATQTPWTDEPLVLGNLANPAGGYGHAYMRSDWTTTAVYGSFYARPADFDYGNGKDPYDYAGSLIVQRGSNALSVEAQGECARNFPVTQAGAGAAIAASAGACMAAADGNKGYHGYGNWTAGFYKIKSTAGNPSTTTTVGSVTLTTNGATAAGSAVLNFASASGVTTGMIAVGTNIPANAFVLAVTSTTVTIDQNVTGSGVASSASVVFATFGSYPSGSADGDVPGIGLFGNGTYGQPGQEDAAPVSATVGTTWTNSPSYTVSGATLTVSPTIPTSFSWGNGTTVLFTWATGATPPTYYLSGSSGATESVIRGDPYVIVNWNAGGTFGVIKAPTYIGHGASYPTTGTALVFATSGTGTQYVQGTPGVLTPKGHPARIDLLESTANYAYARGVGLEADYSGVPNTTIGSRVLTSQREVLYLLPKLFLVYDRTQQTHQNQQQVSFTSLIDSDGTNPVTLVTAGHTFHSGMQVKLTSVSGTGCSGLNNQTYTITALDGTHLSLNGQTTALGATTCTGTATGNKWGQQLISWTTGAVPTEVTTAGQITAGMRQWHVKAPAVSISSIGNTAPVRVVTATPHLLNTGMSTVIAGQSGGCSSLNGAWWVTAIDLYTFTLNGSTACGAVGAVGTSQKFNGAITTILPKTPPAVLQDPMLTVGQTGGSGMIYRLEIHDPRSCTSNSSWCLPSGADTADSQNWLTALDASVSAADTAILTLLTSTNADMVQVGTGTVAGFQNARVGAGNCANSTCTAPAPVLPMSYSFTQGTGAVSHYLAGVTPGATYYVNASTPGSVTISSTGSTGATVASVNGVLNFATQNGVGTAVTTISGPVQIRGSGSIQ